MRPRFKHHLQRDEDEAPLFCMQELLNFLRNDIYQQRFFKEETLMKIVKFLARSTRQRGDFCIAVDIGPIGVHRDVR